MLVLLIPFTRLAHMLVAPLPYLFRKPQVSRWHMVRSLGAAAAQPNGNVGQLMLATGAFALCFAVFGSVSAMMPIIRKQLHLDALQASVVVAVPVLLGSLGRIPLGMLADRYGGRIVFSAVMAFSIIPAMANRCLGSSMRPALPMSLSLCIVHTLHQRRVFQQLVYFFHPWFPQIFDVFCWSAVPQTWLTMSKLDHAASLISSDAASTQKLHFNIAQPTESP